MHQPTWRVMKVLEATLEGGKGKRLTEFSRELEIPKSTLVPILQSLCDMGYLFGDESGRYQAGTALFSLGAAFYGCFPILDYVKGKLEGLVAELKETCYFGVLEGGEVLYLCKQDSPEPLRMLTETGRRMPAYATGIGKALLAELGEKELRRLYPDGLRPLTDRTVTDFGRLAAQLQEILGCGYSWETEESTEYIRCFAVPVKKRGRIAAALSVAVPVFRYEESRKEFYLERLRETGDEISRMMTDTDAHFGNIF